MGSALFPALGQGAFGAGGLACCQSCKNIFSGDKDRVQADRYLRYYKTAMPEDFDRHTDESYWAMADRLETLKNTAITKSDFKKKQQSFGLHYDPSSLVFDKSLREHFGPASTCFWDWTHVLLTSGGVMQFQVNEFLLDMVDYGIDIGVLDQTLRSFVLENASRCKSLGTKFFTTRMSRTRCHHIKAFAGEMLTVVCFFVI